MDHTPLSPRARTAEDEYFRRRDENLQRALIEHWLDVRPPEALFLTGRRVLTDRLRALDARTRQQARAL